MLYKDDAPARQRASSPAGQFPLKKRTRPGPFASLHDPFRPRRVASLAPVLQAAGEAGDDPIGDRPPSYRLSLAAEAPAVAQVLPSRGFPWKRLFPRSRLCSSSLPTRAGSQSTPCVRGTGARHWRGFLSPVKPTSGEVGVVRSRE
jgi:hypothetical protein